MESVTDESINAVADILRVFFRQLENPLLPEDCHDKLFNIGNTFIILFIKIIFS